MHAVDTSYEQAADASARDLSHLPGTNGSPVVGHLLKMVKDFNGTVTRHYEKYGEVSRFGQGFIQKGVLVLGPENYKKIYLDPERNFSPKMGYQQSLGPFYGGGLLLHDFDEHRFQRRVFQNSFKNEAMQGYAELMNPILADRLEQWGSEADFLFFNHIKALLLDIAAKVFFGIDDLGEDAKKLNQAFIDIAEKGMMGIIKLDIPGLKFHEGLKAKHYAESFIKQLIPERRANDGQDFMSYVVKEKKENGEYFTDDELAPHLTFLMFAAHDTTTSALSHLVMHLGQNPQIQEALREESMALGKEVLEYEDLEKLPYLDRAFLESLRLNPSVSMMTRRTIRECELGGFRIPANTVLFLPPFFNHRMAKWWDDPLKFDPDRFLPERAEHKRHPFQFVPFGGGAHKCIGMHFATMNAKCFMYQFLRKYRFKTPANYNPWMQIVPMPRPGDMLPLTLERL